MKRTDPSLIVYIPILHRELLPPNLPEGILTVWPGLPETAVFGMEQRMTPSALPYSPREAAACLEDLRRLNEDDLVALSLPRKEERDVPSNEEQCALRAFSRTGTMPEAVSDTALVETRRWAQRFLLLGWLQEERVLEMASLTARYRAGAARLAARFGNGDESQAEENESLAELFAPMNALMPDDARTLLPSWRFMLDLLGVLLPPEQVLFTADQRMVESLTGAGLCREPLPDSITAGLPNTWSPSILESLNWGRLPLWRILGKTAPVPDKKWLDAERDLVLCTQDVFLE